MFSTEILEESKKLIGAAILALVFVIVVAVLTLSDSANKAHAEEFNEDRFEVIDTYTMFNGQGTAIELKDKKNGTCHIYMKRFASHFVMYETPCVNFGAYPDSSATDEVSKAQKQPSLVSSRPNQSSFTW